MTITWTFKPGTSDVVTLKIVYMPQLDQHDLKEGGFLDIHTNTAFVNWNTFQQFDLADIKARKEAYSRLIRIDIGADNQLEDQLVKFST